MKKANVLALLLLFSISIVSFGQQGIIRGTVIDDATGESLIGVATLIKGTSNGSVSDFDGKFEIGAASGTYDLQISYVGYAPVTIQEIKVDVNQITVLDNIRMQEEMPQLEEVVVTAEMLNTTEEALLTVKRKSANLMDGISSANFRKIGDSDEI